MKNLVTFITFFPLLLGFILAAVWWTQGGSFESVLTGLGLLATGGHQLTKRG